MSVSNQGKFLERLVESSQGVVRVRKIPHGMKHIGQKRVIACKSLVDFTGVVVGTGQSVWLDAKMCSNPNRFITSLDTITAAQRDVLRDMGEAGAVAGILAMSTSTDQLYWLSWRRLKVVVPSIPWDQMPCVGSARKVVDWQQIVAVDSICAIGAEKGAPGGDLSRPSLQPGAGCLRGG